MTGVTKMSPKACNHDSFHFEQFGQKLVCDECKRIYFIQLEKHMINDVGYSNLSLFDGDKRANPNVI